MLTAVPALKIATSELSPARSLPGRGDRASQGRNGGARSGRAAGSSIVGLPSSTAKQRLRSAIDLRRCCFAGGAFARM